MQIPLQKSTKEDLKNNLKDVLDNSDFYEDIAFLVPQILNYYGVIGDTAAILPYATVGLIFDSTKLLKNIADIINEGENIKKLNKIKCDFESYNEKLLKEIVTIQRKNEKKAIKNATLNFTRIVGDVLCFSVGTWLYGEGVKISSTVAETIIECHNHLKQKGRDKAKEKGEHSFYAKIFNMEKSTDAKIKQKCEIVRLINEELNDYINTMDDSLKNKKFEKLDLYVRILSRYKKSFGVKKNWDEILDRQSKCRQCVTNDEGTTNEFSFVMSFVDVWQFQRFILMLGFVNEIKKSINNISKKSALKVKLKHIKHDIKNNKCRSIQDEYGLVKFLIRHNKKSLKDVAYKITILGSDIVGQLGEFVTYFKETVLNIVGIFVKLFGTILGQGVRIKNKKSTKTKKVSKNASIMLNIIRSVESLNLDYETFLQHMTRLNIYLDEIDLKWKDVSNKKDDKLQEMLENALI